MLFCKGKETLWGVWTSPIEPSTSVFFEVSTFHSPRVLYLRGSRGKKQIFWREGSKTSLKDITIQRDSRWKPTNPDTLNPLKMDQASSLAQGMYHHPFACSHSLTRSRKDCRTGFRFLGTGLPETFCCLCFIMIAHWGGTDHLSFPVTSLWNQEIPAWKGPCSFILEWTDHIWSDGDRAQNTIYVGFPFPWQFPNQSLSKYEVITNSYLLRFMLLLITF